jgi:hypothetical protein
MALHCPKCKGVLNFSIEGKIIKLQSDGDVTILLSEQARTEIYDGEFTMIDRNPKIVATVVVPVDMYVRYFQELCNIPVVVELCDGRTFSTDHASQISTDPYDTKTNLQPLELICDEIVELLPVAVAA